jgi:hypothetical protein
MIIEVYMKKLLTIFFAYLVVALPASATLTTDDVRSQEYIINHGYSEETAKIIDLQNAQINGEKSTFVSTSRPIWRSKYKPVNMVVDYFRNGFICSDDGQFAKHKIDFNTRWDDL